MEICGCCFFAKNCPREGSHHFIIITSKENPDGMVLAVPISSIKFKENSHFSFRGRSCKYYDSSCILEEESISDENGNFILTKPSFARYEMAQEVNANNVFKMMLDKDLFFKCKISKKLLEQVQQGAKTSKELPPYFKKYFDYF